MDQARRPSARPFHRRQDRPTRSAAPNGFTGACPPRPCEVSREPAGESIPANWQGFNLRRGAVIGVVLGLLIAWRAPAERRYFLIAIFGALIVALRTPAGRRPPAARMAVMAVAGALLTALAFGIGGGAWGFVVLAAFVATLLAGLAVKYGLHRFVAAYLLNIWFIVAGLPALIAFGLPGSFRSALIHAEPWKQALAWLVGAALAIAYTCIMWLVRGRGSSRSRSPRSPGIPRRGR